MPRLGIMGGLLVATLAGAAPIPPGGVKPPPPASKKKSDDRGLEFAHRLDAMVQQIALRYVRPISRADLLHAALLGLYRQAQHPVPPQLRERVEKAVKHVSRIPPPVGIRVGIPEKLETVLPPTVALILDVYRELEQELPDNPQREPLLVICCRSMSHLLDPHSGIVTAAQERKNLGLSDEVEGLGLIFTKSKGVGPLVIRKVLPGGPAQRAGLLPGEVLTHLDGKTLWGPGSAERRAALRDNAVGLSSPPLTEAVPDRTDHPLRLTVRGRDASSRKLVLRREPFRPESIFGIRREEDNHWNFWVDHKQRLAEVRVGSLGRGTAQELRDALTQLRSQDLKGLILDLRWCPGGFLDEAVAVADLLLGKGEIATLKVRDQEDTVYRSTAEGKNLDFALVVLIGADTRGGGELIAAALQDHGRGIVVGQRSHGKASVQTPLYLGLSGVGMKLTTGTFVRPSGKNLHRFRDSKLQDDWGVRPDPRHEFRISPQLNQALAKWWQAYILRPGSSRKRLVLDDPRRDPPGLFALEVLRQAQKDQEKNKK
jgi:carboxyl-terminal processing protease